VTSFHKITSGLHRVHRVSPYRIKNNIAIPQRLALAEVIAAMEKIKREKWASFRDRHGDGARDMILYVAMAIKRYENKLTRDVAEARRMSEITKMLNVKM
jgi:hypothetical protein